MPSKPAAGIDDRWSGSGGLAVNFGIWQGFLIALNLPYVLVAPATWQAVFGIHRWKKLQEKGLPVKSPLELAREHFPDAPLEYKADSGCAVRLLLAKLAAHDTTRGIDRGAMREVRQDITRKKKKAAKATLKAQATMFW